MASLPPLGLGCNPLVQTYSMSFPSVLKYAQSLWNQFSRTDSYPTQYILSRHQGTSQRVWERRSASSSGRVGCGAASGVDCLGLGCNDDSHSTAGSEVSRAGESCGGRNGNGGGGCATLLAQLSNLGTSIWSTMREACEWPPFFLTLLRVITNTGYRERTALLPSSSKRSTTNPHPARPEPHILPAILLERITAAHQHL